MGANAVNAFSFLFHTLITLYALLFLMRLLLQLVRANFFNPVTQFVVAMTDPVLKPLNRVIPTWRRLDLSAIVVFLLLTAVAVMIKMGFHYPGPGMLAWQTLRLSLVTIFSLYTVLIIAQVILSWVGQGLRHPIIPLIYQLTEPLMRPVRKWIPPIAGFDLSPLVVLLLIHFLRYLLGLY